MQRFGTVPRRISFSVGLIVSLSIFGCVSTNSNEPISPTNASLFKQALFAQYSELMQRERAEGNNDAADIYLEKARDLNAGSDPDLTFDSWSLAHDDDRFFVDSLLKIKDLVDQRARDVEPHESARAVAMFDCWLEEKMEAVDPGGIAACRTSFLNALVVIERSRASDRQVVN